jgi:hypothetical protein
VADSLRCRRRLIREAIAINMASRARGSTPSASITRRMSGSDNALLSVNSRLALLMKCAFIVLRQRRIALT